MPILLQILKKRSDYSSLQAGAYIIVPPTCQKQWLAHPGLCQVILEKTRAINNAVIGSRKAEFFLSVHCWGKHHIDFAALKKINEDGMTCSVTI